MIIDRKNVQLKPAREVINNSIHLIEDAEIDLSSGFVFFFTKIGRGDFDENEVSFRMDWKDLDDPQSHLRFFGSLQAFEVSLEDGVRSYDMDFHQFERMKERSGRKEPDILKNSISIAGNELEFLEYMRGCLEILAAKYDYQADRVRINDVSGRLS